MIPSHDSDMILSGGSAFGRATDPPSDGHEYAKLIYAVSPVMSSCGATPTCWERDAVLMMDEFNFCFK